MGSMPQNFPISLQSWPSKPNDPTSNLPSFFERIKLSRGGLLNITEEGLRQEIAEGEAAAAAGEDDGESDEEKAGEPDRLNELMTARADMLGYIYEAHTEATLALNVVSLLLTKDQPVQASATIDPVLRELVPMGSLGADKLSASRYTDAQRLDSKRAAKGWKIQSLNKAADSILASATRLEKEIEKETKYWEQILSVSDAGWSLCRLPNEKHTLGVRFGFSEAAPAFKTRSLTALRRNPDGSIYLDQGVATPEPKALRVRIQSSSTETGSSPLPLPLSDDAPIESIILQARNNIFDSELWQELNREARALAAYGVLANEDTITYPLTPDKTIVLDFVHLGDYSHPRTDDKIAEGFCIALHLLLSYSHRQRHRRRTQIPPPISNQKQNLQPYSLLRPLITHMNHQTTITSIHKLFKPLCAVLGSAKVVPWPTYEIVATPPLATLTNNLSATELVIYSLTDNLESVTTFKITETTSIIIKSRSSMYPVCSTTYHLMLSPESPLNVICKAPPSLPWWNKVEEYVLYATSCALAISFSMLDENDADAWLPTIAANILRKPNPGNEGGRDKQLIFQTELMKDTAKLKVSWEHHSPEYANTLRSGNDSKKAERSYEWKANGEASKKLYWDDGEEEVVKSLQNVVEEAGKP